jgi:hypothetical protein
VTMDDQSRISEENPFVLPPPTARIEWEWQRFDYGIWMGIVTHDDYSQAIREPFMTVAGRCRLIRRTITEVELPQ